MSTGTDSSTSRSSSQLFERLFHALAMSSDHQPVSQWKKFFFSSFTSPKSGFFLWSTVIEMWVNAELYENVAAAR